MAWGKASRAGGKVSIVRTDPAKRRTPRSDVSLPKLEPSPTHSTNDASGNSPMRTDPAKRPRSDPKLGCNLAIGGLRARLGNLFSCQPQTINVKRDGIVHLTLDLALRSTGGNAARQIGRIGGVAGRGVFDNDQITVHLSPACFKILFFVPGARSWPGLPEIVTSPRLLECLYWRWLPRVRSRYPTIFFDEFYGFSDFHPRDAIVRLSVVNGGGGEAPSGDLISLLMVCQ